MVRDGIDRDEAIARIGTQMNVREKVERADYAIDTSGALEETIARAEAVATFLQGEARAGRFNP